MQNSQTKLALRPREAAKMLSISERTLWALTKQGRIPCVKLGEGRTSAVLYPVSSLEEFLSQGMTQLKEQTEPDPMPQEATPQTLNVEGK